ncbi:hypothetical protein D9M68_824860 [compost metagenome]
MVIALPCKWYIRLIEIIYFRAHPVSIRIDQVPGDFVIDPVSGETAAGGASTRWRGPIHSRVRDSRIPRGGDRA